jgi:hypothetical protein
MLEFLGFIWTIVKVLHLWLILSAAITVMALKEGIISVAVAFGGVFIMLLYLDCSNFLSIGTQSRIFLALVVGLIVAFFIWLAK